MFVFAMVFLKKCQVFKNMLVLGWWIFNWYGCLKWWCVCWSNLFAKSVSMKNDIMNVV